jgi:hypothetical protein
MSCPGVLDCRFSNAHRIEVLMELQLLITGIASIKQRRFIGETSRPFLGTIAKKD